VVPKGINTNETVYMIRHAEAHPVPNWDDGNYIAPGQWRALLLPQGLQGKIHPTQVYSIDPAVGFPSGLIDGVITSSYVRPSLTVEPYAIANNLPFNLAASVPVFAQNAPQLSTYASNFFFTQGTFSNETLLVAWEHNHIPPTVNALLASFGSSQVAPNWPSDDYDTIWTIKFDSQGNLTVDNGMCEGIGSSLLPVTAPQFLRLEAPGQGTPRRVGASLRLSQADEYGSVDKNRAGPVALHQWRWVGLNSRKPC